MVNSDAALKGTRWLMVINLGLVAAQPISAGLLLSGYDYASTIHAVVAVALQLGVFVQGVIAVGLWLGRRVSGKVAVLSVGLFAVVLLEVWAGRHREYWLHVPVGVGIAVWLRGRTNSLDAL
jgi:hypothetical protein